jgi:DNA-binding CsgD family transcriptional regulator
VDTINELRQTIEHLQPMEFETRKHDLLAMIDTLPKMLPFTGTFGAGLDGSSNGRPHARLSPRENEVMTAILNGKRLKEIAANLDISVKTVTTHRSRLLRKLGVEDNLGLYRYGIRNGIIGI